MKRQIIIEIVCFLFIILFLYAGFIKGIDPQRFEIQMKQSFLIARYAMVLSYIVPVAEVILAVMLMFQRTRLWGLYGVFTMMTMFTMYILFILNFAPSIPCSCGGILEQMDWTDHLLFNIGFVMLGLAGIFMETKARKQRGLVYDTQNV
jgi:hypothetical protein